MIIEGKNIYLKKPNKSEIEYIKKLWSDEKTMSAVGGPIKLNDSEWDQWYEKIVGDKESKHFYCLIYRNDGVPIGEVSFHRYNMILKSAELNIKVQNDFRGKGYSTEALKLLLKYYFTEFGGEVMKDFVGKENIKGQDILVKFGFVHKETTEEAFIVEMDKNRYSEIYL